MRHAAWLLGACALALGAVESGAQERPPRRQEPIEIRGRVPTPQVVTVRPREMPAYSRRVLVPNFYDHDFWPAILPPYQMIPERMITGSTPTDTAPRADARRGMPLGSDTLGVRRDSLGRLIPGAARIDTMPLRPDSLRAVPPTGRPPVPPPDAPRDDRASTHAIPGRHVAGTPPASSTQR